MPKYTTQEWRDLDHDAQTASPTHQSMATALVTGLFERNLVAYAVTGLMNFYLRGGTTRAVGPIEIALQAEECYMRDILQIFVTHKGIFRPSDKMQKRNSKVGEGTSKIYVEIHGQLVRIDLKPRGDAATLLRNSFAHSVERLTVATAPVTFPCYLLTIGPLIAFTFKDHHIRSRGQREGSEYDALMTLCQWAPGSSSSSAAGMLSPTAWSARVRRVAPNVPQPWRDSFLRKVMRRNPEEELRVRWALHMPLEPAPVLAPAALTAPLQPLQIGFGQAAAAGGGGGGGEGARAPGTRRNRNTPRHGDRSKDGYWIYSGHLRCWYHKHQDGRYSLEGGFL